MQECKSLLLGIMQVRKVFLKILKYEVLERLIMVLKVVKWSYLKLFVMCDICFKFLNVILVLGMRYRQYAEGEKVVVRVLKCRLLVRLM